MSETQNNIYNLQIGDLFNYMWEEAIKENPEYENIKDNNFRHAIIACANKKQEKEVYEQYLQITNTKT